MALDLKAIQDIADDDGFWTAVRREMGIRMGPLSRRVVFDGIEAAQGAGAMVDLDGIHESALRATRDMETEWWNKIERTSRDSLRTTLTLWQEEGLGKRGLPDLIDAIKPIFGPERAERIAVTEVTRAFALGEDLAYAQDETVAGWIWSTAEDEFVCPKCGPLNNHIYPKGGGPEMPLHPRCRCAKMPADWEYIRAHPNKWHGGAIPPTEGSF